MSYQPHDLLAQFSLLLTYAREGNVPASVITECEAIVSRYKVPPAADPVWVRRPNMGASPVAIECAANVLAELAEMPPAHHHMVVAALVDAAFRRSGVVDLFTTVSAVHHQLSGGDPSTLDASNVQWCARELGAAISRVRALASTSKDSGSSEQ